MSYSEGSEMRHMDIAEIAGVAGGVAVVYVAGYFQAFREQPMLSKPQGVDTVMFFALGMLAFAGAIVVYHKKMEA